MIVYFSSVTALHTQVTYKIMARSQIVLQALVYMCLTSCVATWQLTDTKLDLTRPSNVAAKQTLISAGKSDLHNRMLPFLARTGARASVLNRFIGIKNQDFETFNRPEGTESLDIAATGEHFASGAAAEHLATQYGRTFGQYGSYKKHTSWQTAVAADRHKHFTVPEDLKVKFPWFVNNLHAPTSQGFGLNGFWNSYAIPEGTPNVKGLSTTVIL